MKVKEIKEERTKLEEKSGVQQSNEYLEYFLSCEQELNKLKLDLSIQEVKSRLEPFSHYQAHQLLQHHRGHLAATVQAQFREYHHWRRLEKDTSHALNLASIQHLYRRKYKNSVKQIFVKQYLQSLKQEPIKYPPLKQQMKVCKQISLDLNSTTKNKTRLHFYRQKPLNSTTLNNKHQFNQDNQKQQKQQKQQQKYKQFRPLHQKQFQYRKVNRPLNQNCCSLDRIAVSLQKDQQQQHFSKMQSQFYDCSRYVQQQDNQFQKLFYINNNSDLLASSRLIPSHIFTNQSHQKVKIDKNMLNNNNSQIFNNNINNQREGANSHKVNNNDVSELSCFQDNRVINNDFKDSNSLLVMIDQI